MVILVNLIDFIFIKCFFNLSNFTLQYYIKYTLLSLGVVVILTIFIKLLKRMSLNIEKDDLNLSKPRDLFIYLKRIYYYLKELFNLHSTLCYFILYILAIFILDFYLRFIIFSKTAFFSFFAVQPNLLTLIYSLLISIIVIMLPKIIDYIVMIIFYLLIISLFIVSYMLLMIKGSVLSIYDLVNVNEGIVYLNFLTEHLSVIFIGVIILSLFFFILSFKALKKISKVKGKLERIIVIAGTILLFWVFKNLIIISFANYEEGDWSQVDYPKYYYDNYSNPNRSLQSVGMIAYTFRDIYFYYDNLNHKVGSVEKINKLRKNMKIETVDNEKTGIFKDKNLIMIMLESIDQMQINDEVMPTLNYFKNNGWNFTKRFSKNTSTIATEYTANTGLYYIGNNYNLVNNNYTKSLAALFNINGYNTSSIHENHGYYYNRTKLHKSLNFNNSYFLYDILENPQVYMDSQIITNKKIYNKITKDKFMSFIITMSGHGPYKNNFVCDENKIKGEKNCLDYLSKRTDDMLEKLKNSLEKDGILENMVLVLFSDHYPYSYNFSKEEKSNLEKLDNNYEIRQIPFIIYNPKIEHQDYDMFVNDIDILPTIFNLFGIKYDASLYMGTDIFSSNHPDLLMFSDGSWYDSNGYSLENSTNLNRQTGNYLKQKIELNKMIISNDYYQQIK